MNEQLNIQLVTLVYSLAFVRVVVSFRNAVISLIVLVCSSRPCVSRYF